MELTSNQYDTLGKYQRWLAEEAYPAGGIGPSELSRLEQRHIADSLLFARLLPQDAEEIWDLGTGVGLPGIPLAVAMPNASFRLVDRSGRRVGLARRAVRVLGIANCVVDQADMTQLEGSPDAIVARASLPPPEMEKVVNDLVKPGGVAVVGGSWSRKPTVPGWESVEIPSEVLDHSVWLLIMRRE